MSDTHLQNLEKAMNIAFEAGEIDKAKMMAQEIQSYSNSITPEQKTIGGLAENVGEDVVNIGGAIAGMVRHPLNTTGAIADLGVTAATNFLPESVVDDLFSYENDTNSFQYKTNEYLKNNEYLDFLAAKPRAQYEQMGDIIGKDIQGLIDDPVGRMYNKPVTSLLEATGFGRVATTLAKTAKAGQTANKVGAIADKALNYIDPTKPITKTAGFFADKAKSSQTLAAAQNILQTKATDLGVSYGFKILPSTVAEKGGNVFSRLGEKFVGNKKAITPIVEHNINNANTLIRKHAGLSDSTPLALIYDKLAKKSKPLYTDIAKLKGKDKTVSNNKVLTRDVKQPRRGDPNRKVSRQEIIEGKKRVTDIDSGQSILNKIEAQKKKNNKDYKKSRKENSTITYEKLDKNQKIIDDLHLRLDKTIAYNKKIAISKGATKVQLKKFDKMAENLKKARKNYAIGHSVENALKPDGTFNIKKYADANRDNISVRGNGRAVIDFYDANPTLFKGVQSTTGQRIVDAVKYTAAGGATMGIGGPIAVFAADKLIPNLLKSNRGQKLINSRNPTGSKMLNLLGNPNIIAPGTIIPSLLEDSNIEDLKYLRKKK